MTDNLDFLAGMARERDETERERRQNLLAALAVEGASRCAYLPFVADWLAGRCDCKYRGAYVQPLPPTSEQTGCCEIRAAYRVVAASLKST